jgi:hypothetical protein
VGITTPHHKKVMCYEIFQRTSAWSLILREEHRLRVFENSVLRKIFGPKKDEDRM